MSSRIAVIGAGIMGADHARIIAEDLPGATLQVVCDASAERARAVAEAHGAHDVATDPDAAIRRRDVDAVLIASPDQTHAALTLACIETGKPVLCEKPLSPDSRECLAVIDAETARGRQLVQVGFMRRFDPSYREMRAALTGNTLGAALMMHNFHRNVDAPAGFTGAMAITNSAPHEFDIARFVLGTDYRTVTAFQPAVTATSERVAPVFMVLETTGGQPVSIEINNTATYGYDVRGELVCATGTVSFNAPVHTRVNAELQSVERYPADWRPRFAEAYRLQNRAFVKFVETGILADAAASAWDGLAATLAAEAGVRALTGGSRVAVTMPERPPLYRR